MISRDPKAPLKQQAYVHSFKPLSPRRGLALNRLIVDLKLIRNLDRDHGFEFIAR